MSTTSTHGNRPSEPMIQPVGQLLYRFEADLQVTPIGLAPDGLRMTVDYDGAITRGMLEGARVWGTDPLLLRADGVGVIDTAKTISDGTTALYEHVHAYCMPPDGLEVPPPDVILDPSFEWPDMEFPILGSSSFRAGNPEYGYLNVTVAVIEGWANFATQRNAIETRVLRHTGTAAGPRRD